MRHQRGARRLRLGLGPCWRPVRALHQLQRLFDQHSFWARGRSLRSLRRMLRRSDVAVTAWSRQQLIGFGRASSDGTFRAVLWDVVVAAPHQGQGLGHRIVTELLHCPEVRDAEKVYLMTTNSAGFYRRLGFDSTHRQHLLVLHRPD
ncbi:GNAT family N-acetyltransferase [Synechococcus sp. CBW1004]|nr:GNAT family N-acetyltransferase [Synechococcus sp. CBW1004]QPN65106.1 GNAT family N-acetyltransferase [Synechococcus sp. CBW1004]